MSERVIDIVLNETDRELVRMAARILMALDPGPRNDGFETILQAYVDDLTEAHSGSGVEAFDELTLGFGGALLLEMERFREDRTERAGGNLQDSIITNRRCVIDALGRYVDMVKPNR